MSFVKFGCSIGIFLNSAHLICRSTDISKCFRGSLRLRDNESQLCTSVVLKIEQFGLTIWYCIKKMQIEWQATWVGAVCSDLSVAISEILIVVKRRSMWLFI